MLRIPIQVYEKMVDHAKREWPLECCGILSGRARTVEKAFEVPNAEESPVRYVMAAEDQMRVFEEMERDSLEMLAVYHSHPHTIPFPSETDVNLCFYPDVASVIISLEDTENPVTKAFHITKEAIYPEEIKVIP